MSRLEEWLKQATKNLALEAASQVRREIQEHYESACELAIRGGASVDDADRTAVAALGCPDAANRQYRRVLLTRAEARLLRSGNREARWLCSRRWLKGLLAGAPIVALAVAAVLFLDGRVGAARVLLAGGIIMTLVFAAPLLPIYTPRRSRVYRGLKFLAMGATLVLLLGDKTPWLLTSCLWPFVWIEWTRASIRRKLRTEEWPRQLYL